MSSSQTVRMSVCAASERAIASTEGRQPPGKITWLEKLGCVLLGLVGAVVDADRLQEEQPVGRQQLRAAPKKRSKYSQPTASIISIETSCRSALRGRGSRCPITRTQVVEAGAPDPRLGVGALLARDRRRRHPAAVARGRVNGEPAPAGADLEQVRRRAELERVGRSRSSFARWARSSESCRVSKSAHEYIIASRSRNSSKSVVAEVVVGGDVAPGAGDGCCGRHRGAGAEAAGRGGARGGAQSVERARSRGRRSAAR